LKGITASNEAFAVVFPEVFNVGYHGWYDNDNAYAFIVAENGGTNHELVSVSRVRAGSLPITKFVGRNIRRIPESTSMSYVAKDDPEKWYVLELNVLNNESKVITETVKGSEDLAWLDKDNLIMAKGSKVYHNNLTKNTGWESVSASSLSDIDGEITRIAVSPNNEWLAFVVTR